MNKVLHCCCITGDYARNQCPTGDSSCTPCPSRLPSCVGLDDGYQKVGTKEWGTRYMECKKNRTMSLRNCPDGAFFNPTDHRCTQSINTGEST